MQKKHQIMGILNLTPDSFSDGGEFNKIKLAVNRAKQMQTEGADIIDVGGESTGPGSKEVSEEEELQRVIPTIIALKKVLKIPISIDSYKSSVVSQSLEAGVDMVNDISALRFDPDLASLIAKSDCKLVMMYSKDDSARTTIEAHEYQDVISHIKDFFTERLNFAEKNGISRDRIIIDPGMGQFISNNSRHSFEIIERLAELKSLGQEILLGISRKSFLGGKMEDRDKKALPFTSIAYINGASIIRTHDVKGIKELHKTLS
jgi:dihydropteroate synthase